MCLTGIVWYSLTQPFNLFKLRPYFLVLATRSHALPFYICHFTMSKWMAKAEEKKRKEKHCVDSFAALFSILWFGLFP